MSAVSLSLLLLSSTHAYLLNNRVCSCGLCWSMASSIGSSQWYQPAIDRRIFGLWRIFAENSFSPERAIPRRLSELIFLFSSLFHDSMRNTYKKKIYCFSLMSLDWFGSLIRDLMYNKTFVSSSMTSHCYERCCSLSAKRQAIVDDPPARWDRPSARNRPRCRSVSLHEIIPF